MTTKQKKNEISKKSFLCRRKKLQISTTDFEPATLVIKIYRFEGKQRFLKVRIAIPGRNTVFV